MSQLIDQYIDDTIHIGTQHMFSDGKSKGGWYISKPLNDTRQYRPWKLRIGDAWRVLWCKSFAVHYKQDELEEQQ